ncbi:hypothetical protein BDV97DRAFT_387164 [Delphinella strobiligena]|nr:hypothetical protein BDV97DRAFT_387164 [Delphinella strobiligena]
MCRQTFIWHMMCNHLSIHEEQCDQALSPFSTPLFCDNYQVVQLSTNTARCRGLHCKDDSVGKWNERDGPRVAQLSLDIQDLKDLIGVRELECQFATQRWYRGGPLQQTREEEHYVRLQEELTELRLKKYKLQLHISAIEDFYNPAKNTRGFDRALYLAEFLKRKNRLTAAASRKNASIPLPIIGIPRFTPFVKIPDTSDKPALLIPRLDSNYGTLKGYVAAIEPANDSGIFTSWPSHHNPLNHAAPNDPSNNADISTELAVADMLVTDEQKDSTPQSPTTRLRTSSNIAKSRSTELASNLRSRLRGTGSKRSRAGQTSVEDITSSVARRSGRLSGKGRKNYAESSSDETSLSPSQTILRQPASQRSRGTSVSNGSKRRKTAEDLDDDFYGDDEGRLFDLDPQDDEDCGMWEPTPSKRPSNSIDGWCSPSVLLEDVSGGCKAGGVTSLHAAQKPSGLLGNAKVLDALRKLQAQTDTAHTASSQSQKYGIAPMAPMYSPSSTILSRASPALDAAVQPSPSMPAMFRGTEYVPDGSATNLQQANKFSPQTVLSGREDGPIESDYITASPRSAVPLVDAQLLTSTFHTAPQYHDRHGTSAFKEDSHHMSRMASIGIPQIFLGQPDIHVAQPPGQSRAPGLFGPNVNGGSFEDVNFDDMINFGEDEV